MDKWDGWRALLLHICNIAAAVVLAMKGHDSMAFVVFGASFGALTPSQVKNRILGGNGGDTLTPATRPVAQPGIPGATKLTMLLLATSALLGSGCATMASTGVTDAKAEGACLTEAASAIEQCSALALCATGNYEECSLHVAGCGAAVVGWTRCLKAAHAAESVPAQSPAAPKTTPQAPSGKVSGRRAHAYHARSREVLRLWARHRRARA